MFNLSLPRKEIGLWNPRVLDVGWPDQLAPPLERLCSVCRALDSWLQADPQHVAVLHSKCVTRSMAYIYFFFLCKFFFFHFFLNLNISLRFHHWIHTFSLLFLFEMVISFRHFRHFFFICEEIASWIFRLCAFFGVARLETGTYSSFITIIKYELVRVYYSL